MDGDIKQRLVWIKHYEQTRNAQLTCRRCGISAPTLRKWWRRYQSQGEAGLASQSRRPKSFPRQKTTKHIADLIQLMRQQRRLGARRIQGELLRLHQIRLSRGTVQKILNRSDVKPLRRLHRKVRNRRYSAGIPGARVQVDTIKIAPGLFQYTAVDDCTRWLCAALFPRRTAANTLSFLENMIEEFIFPIQRIQTDNGTEFTSWRVTERLEELHIRWRPIRRGAPHLNGKVERTQKTVIEELYSVLDLGRPDLADELGYYVTYYNYQRVHSSIGMTPMDKKAELGPVTPTWEDLWPLYDPVAEYKYHFNRLRKIQFGG